MRLVPEQVPHSSPPAAAERDLVTVVVPARNEEATIGRVLRCILDQTFEDLEVLVVDGESTDATARIVSEIAAEDDRVRLLSNPDRVIPAALNLAGRHARGRWLVRVDAHSSVPVDYVERLVAHLRSGRWGGVGGRKVGRGFTPAGRAIAAVMSSKLAQGNSVYHYGDREQVVDHVPFGAYPLDVVRELEGWAEDQYVNEDYEFDYRLRSSGHSLLFDPEIVIEWDCRQSVPALFRQYRRYGAGKVQTLVKHPSSAGVRHVAAPGLVLLVAAGCGLLLPRRTRALGAAVLAPYAAVLIVGGVGVAGELDTTEEKLWVVPAFVALHMGWGIGFWQELLRQAVGRGGPRPSLAAS